MKKKVIVNVFFDEKGVSIKDILEMDFLEFVNRYIKENILKN